MSDNSTKGPWFVMEGGFAKQGLWSAPTVYAADDELRYVAVCACADEINFYTPTDNLANAYLISAVPEFKALAEAVARLNPNAGEIGEGMLHRLVSMANMALTKSTGESE